VGRLRLTLLRHGQAQAIDSCKEDFERALTRRGYIEAQEMARRLAHRDLAPDLILVSPAERTWATAEIVAGICELDAKQIQCARELYLATPEATWRILARRNLSVSHVLICGHNPGLSQLASRMGPKPQRRELPTAGLATATWSHDTWQDLQPELAEACDQDDPESAAEPWE